MGYFMPAPTKHPRTGIYHLRLRVPKEIQPVIKKRELWRSLRTRDLAEAKVRFAGAYRKAQEDFDLARLSLESDISLKPRDLEILADQWLEFELARCEDRENLEQWVIVSSHTDEFGEEDEILLHLRDVMEEPPWELPYEQQMVFCGNSLVEFLKTKKIPLVEGSEAFRKLLLKVCERTYPLSDFCMKRLFGDWHSSYGRLSRETSEIEGSLTKAPRLSKVLEMYLEHERLLEGRELKRFSEVALQARRLIGFTGDVSVADVTPELLFEYRDLLLRSPSSKKPAIKDLPLKQQVAMAERDDLPRLSQRTVIKSIRLLGGLFSYAIERGYIRNNPTFGTTKRLSRSPVGGDDRGHSKQDLELIFSSPLFLDSSFDKGLSYGDARYWVPLLCYYTGARLREVCQLAVKDILQEDGVWCMAIREGEEGQSVKSRRSRLVPLHPDLVAVGFIEFVQGLTTTRVFPLLKANKHGDVSAQISKWFSKYFRSLGVSDKVSPIHGFRHNFKTMCRTVGMPEEVHDALTGHGRKTVGRSYGNVEVSAASAWVQKLPGIPMLRQIVKRSSKKTG